MVEVARDEAEAGRREGVTRSSTVLEVGLCAGAHWGAMAGFCVTPSGWVPDRISATPRLLLLPRASPGTKEPPLQASTQHPQSPGGASHQACVVPVHTLRLLHHAGEAAGTGRGAGEVLQHFCSLGCSLRSATDSVPSGRTHAGPLLGQEPVPAQEGPSASSLTPWGLLYSSLGLGASSRHCPS